MASSDGAVRGRVDPADAVEAGEVAVEGTYAGTVLDGESGRMSVRAEV